MERQLSGAIRKLIWGLIPTQPYLIIGVGLVIRAKIKGVERSFEVVEIIEDESTFEKFGRFEYLVFVREANIRDADVIFYKRFYKTPDAIEYFLPEQEEEILI